MSEAESAHELGATAEPEHDARPTIFELLPQVMERLPGIGKDHQMGDGRFGYKYRSIEDITPHVQRAFAELGVTVVPTVRRHNAENIVVDGKTRRQVDMDIQWTFYGPRGDHIEAMTHGEARDSGDKATQKAATSAFKYMLMHTFMIGDPDDDLDNDKEHAPQPRPPRAAARKPPVEKPVAEAKSGPQYVMPEENRRLGQMWSEVPEANRAKLKTELEENPRLGKNLLTRQLTPAQVAEIEQIMLKHTPVELPDGVDQETGEIAPAPAPKKEMSKPQLLMVKGRTDHGLDGPGVHKWVELELGLNAGTVKSLKQLTDAELDHCIQKLDWQKEAELHG